MNRPSKSEHWRFAWDSILLIGSSGVAGLFFLAVHVVMGRIMPELAYASLVSLLGLLNVLNLPSTAIQVVMARYVAQYAHQNAVELWVTLVKRAVRRITICGVIILVVWFALSGLLKEALHAPSAASLMTLGIIAFVSLYIPVVQGTLQGARRFGWFVASGLVNAAGRLAVSIAAFLLFRSVTSVLSAVAISVAAAIVTGYWPFHKIVTTTAPLKEFDTKPIYRYLWPVLIGQGAIFLLMNADLILSARFLSGSELAAYGKAAMLSRIVLFLPQPIAIAMFPRAVTSPKSGLIIGPLVVALLVALFTSVFMTLAPGIPMKLMYGISDPLYLDLVRKYVWAAIPLALLNILPQYLWARDRTGVVLTMLPAAMLYLVLLAFFHGSPTQIILCLAIGGVFSLVLLALPLLFSGRATSQTTKTRCDGNA